MFCIEAVFVTQCFFWYIQYIVYIYNCIVRKYNVYRCISYIYIYMYLMYLVGGFFTILKILVNGKDYPIYYDIYIYILYFFTTSMPGMHTTSCLPTVGHTIVTPLLRCRGATDRKSNSSCCRALLATSDRKHALHMGKLWENSWICLEVWKRRGDSMGIIGISSINSGDDMGIYPPVIKLSRWTCLINEGFNRKIN